MVDERISISPFKAGVEHPPSLAIQLPHIGLISIISSTEGGVKAFIIDGLFPTL
ncbi:MAG: hypothetical protein QXS36_02570 [Candidatus Bathyarchaeia archaeon]